MVGGWKSNGGNVDTYLEPPFLPVPFFTMVLQQVK